MLVSIDKIKNNQKNPRVIKDHKFEKLKKSIEEFPDMLNKRPLIVFTDKDGKYVVLGGNMRLKAAKELGIKELPVIIADDWTEEQKAEFLVKDNVNFGEWNFDELANEWDSELLTNWGLDIPNFSLGHDVNDLSEDELDINEQFDPIGVSGDIRRLIFIFDNDYEAEEWFKKNNPNLKIEKKGNAWHVNLSTIIQ